MHYPLCQIEEDEDDDVEKKILNLFCKTKKEKGKTYMHKYMKQN